MSMAQGGSFLSGMAAGTVTAKVYVGGAAVVIDTETMPGTHTIATRYLLKDTSAPPR